MNEQEEKEKIIFDLEQRESLEEENRHVHNTNNSTIARLQELETTGVQLQVNRCDISSLKFFSCFQSLESLWNKERELYVEQIQRLEQSLVESKKLSIEQQTQIMQITVQLESADGQLQAQVCDRSIGKGNDCFISETSIGYGYG